MEAPRNIFTLDLFITFTVCFIALAIYRLFFDPLAKFPGPKLAAITRYYEMYYDIVRNGQYGFQIAKMHEKYGPIVRISPYELHIKDPAYFEKLYRHEGRWNKYPWAVDAQNANGAIIFTADHDQHRARRQPLNSYFSKARIASRHELISSKVQRLCERIVEFADSKRCIDIGAAISAFQRDVSTDFVLGKDYRSLDQEDFGIGMTHVMQAGGQMWRLTKHIRLYGPAMLSIPKNFLIKHADRDTASFMRYVKASELETDRLLKVANSSHDDDDKESTTIVHEIVKSKLPPEEKLAKRVFADVATVTGAGFETTASVLRLAVYHVYSNPDILQRLRREIYDAVASSLTSDLELRTIEQLPYITAVLMESMRFSPALGTRLQRIAPDRDLVYDKWVIPAGTPVGMTTLHMHMDDQLYPEPKRFNPDRWMDTEFRKRAEKVYAPFSRGGRICLGMHLAWANMYLVLSALVQQFDFNFDKVKPDHFDFVSDQFIIGTNGKGVLEGFVTSCKR